MSTKSAAFEEASRRISKAQNERETILRLENLELTELPLQVLQLQDINQLYLQGNRIDRIPPRNRKI